MPKGFDVLAYDGRAHGDSTGNACTYGVLEKQDLRRTFAQLGVRRAILVGGSLGAAVALQAAPDDPRVIAVVAASTFSDLETIARDRAPVTMRDSQVREAFALVEKQAGFRVADASPVRAASRITAPVLVIHGAKDRETSPEHSRRVYAALAGPKTLRIVEGAGHNGPLLMIWPEVEAWIENIAGPGDGEPAASEPSDAMAAIATPEAAEQTLRGATTFRASAVGEAGTIPPEVHAFRGILAAPNALDGFLRLEAGASIAGRLYAACGLFFLDAKAFGSAVERLKSLPDEVETQDGCMVTTRRVADVVAAQAGAPKLSHAGGYREWIGALRSLRALDIPGGS